VADLSPVEAQLHAYNAGDVERFLSSYSPDVVVEDGAGHTLMRGREQMRLEYTAFFAGYPDLRGEVVQHTAIGDYVIDEEVIRGGESEPVRAVVIYHVAEGLIDHVRMYEG
jgi:uncharacterized protein (TIGR02246 family)